MGFVDPAVDAVFPSCDVFIQPGGVVGAFSRVDFHADQEAFARHDGRVDVLECDGDLLFGWLVRDGRRRILDFLEDGEVRIFIEEVE